MAVWPQLLPPKSGSAQSFTFHAPAAPQYRVKFASTSTKTEAKDLHHEKRAPLAEIRHRCQPRGSGLFAMDPWRTPQARSGPRGCAKAAHSLCRCPLGAGDRANQTLTNVAATAVDACGLPDWPAPDVTRGQHLPSQTHRGPLCAPGLRAGGFGKCGNPLTHCPFFAIIQHHDLSPLWRSVHRCKTQP